MARYTQHLFMAVAVNCIVFAYTMPGRWSRALDSPWGRELERCKSNWVQISTTENPQEVARCLHMLVMAIAPRMTETKGLEPIGQQRFDPLSFPQEIAVGGGNQPFRGTLRNAAMGGMSLGLTPQLSTAKYDPKKKELTLVVRTPPIEMTTDYNITLDPSALFGQGGAAAGRTTTGRSFGMVESSVATLVVGFDKARSGELRVRSARSDFAYGPASMKVKGTDPKDPLNGLLQLVMDNPETPKLFIEYARPHINNALASGIGALYHRGWRSLEQL